MKKILFINPLGENLFFLSILGEKFSKKSISIPFLEFAENFPKIFIKFFQENNYDEIWVINGPGAFTKMRIITLTINALKFSHPNITLKTAHFFDLFIDSDKTPILEANNNEFLYRGKDETENFCLKSELPKGEYIGLFDITSTNFDKLRQYFGELRQTSTKNINISTYIDYTHNPVDIIKIFTKIFPIQFITPIYIKPPHITYGTK